MDNRRVNLLTDPRITAFSVGRDRSGLFSVEITFGGRAYCRSGLDTISQAYHWASAVFSTSLVLP